MHRQTVRAFLATAALTLAATAGHAAADAPRYAISKSVALGAPDRWDYVVFDPATHYVFVAHADRVTVVDGRDGRRIGEVTGLTGAHGTAISPDTGMGFADDGKTGEVLAFDLKTLAVKTHIPVEKDADAMTFDPASGHVFVIEGDPHKITVIDPKTNAVLANLDGGEGLEYAAADGKGGLFVAGAEKRDVVKVDTRTNTVEAHWPIADCASPHGAAIDAAANRLFISCVNHVMVVVDTTTGREVASVAIGGGTDAAAFDPVRKRAFSSNGLDGTITVIQETDPNTFVAAGTIPTSVSGRTMSIDPRTGRLYVAAADTEPSATPGGRPRAKPGTLKLLFLDPAN